MLSSDVSFSLKNDEEEVERPDDETGSGGNEARCDEDDLCQTDQSCDNKSDLKRDDKSTDTLILDVGDWVLVRFLVENKQGNQVGYKAFIGNVVSLVAENTYCAQFLRKNETSNLNPNINHTYFYPNVLDVTEFTKDQIIKRLRTFKNRRVKHIPRSDANIFPEYILPSLASLAVDSNTSVRAAYAQNIATLAEIALRYLEQTQTDWCDKGNSGKSKDVPHINYEIEVQTLHDMVQQSVSALLTDSPTLVKQTLLENRTTKLCIFFGKQKENPNSRKENNGIAPDRKSKILGKLTTLMSLHNQKFWQELTTTTTETSESDKD
ncbi:hypothetical protein RN001_010037 [Aquatica leii]|uniref:Phosphatase 2A Regulatory Subunit A helical domain-containing protein n=1 Tax=Aquatica leii TaxID=1421715 RepID=A0AAN7S8E3_9COLE|nr:hypothetical protein RN001_010037 [Aquatica leii]